MSAHATDHLHDSAAAYALDALTPDERREFEVHLRGCESCRAEVAELSEAAAALAFAVDAPDPPPALRGAILGDARREKPNVVPLRPRWTRPWVASIAAAAVLALGLGLWATIGSNGPGRPAQTVALKGASGTLSVSASGHAFISLHAIPPAPTGRTYELWVIENGKPARAGLFARAGTIPVMRDVPAGSTVAATLERAGGVDAPTGKIVFEAQVTA